VADPWFKFYASDWRSDPALRVCSLAARGLWIEMICLMHEANPYGHLLVNGHSLTDTQLGALVGASPDQIAALLGELESAGVFSRTRAGVIYSRKMSRLVKKAATARNNGRKGGNPSLGKKTEIPPLDNLEVKGGDKPQIPEARSQKKEREANASPKKVGSRLSAGWVLPDEWREWATEQGLSDSAATDQAERFRDYWLGKTGRDAAKADWQATWRNWVRKALEDQQQRKQPERKREPEYGDRVTRPDGVTVVYHPFHGWVREY